MDLSPYVSELREVHLRLEDTSATLADTLPDDVDGLLGYTLGHISRTVIAIVDGLTTYGSPAPRIESLTEDIDEHLGIVVAYLETPAWRVFRLRRIRREARAAVRSLMKETSTEGMGRE